jgi:hypothetical protein
MGRVGAVGGQARNRLGLENGREMHVDGIYYL